MINNLKIIKTLLNFEKPGDFYMLYVFKRKKDQPIGERDNHQSVRTIKTYCIESITHLESRYEEVIQLCEMFKARAYIHVQKQNHHDVSLNMLVALAQRIQDKNHNQKNLFDSVVGQLKTQEKRWIIDIDDVDEVSPLMLAYIDHKCKPYGSKIESIIPTKSGFHLITKKFDVMKFKEKYPDLDLQKKNPTLLYYPNSLENGK